MPLASAERVAAVASTFSPLTRASAPVFDGR
jgi:hypothetical protein